MAIQIETTREKLDHDWLVWALHNGGYTLQDIASEHNITREGMRQIADGWKIDSSRSSHTPMWHANKQDRPQLGNKEWVEKKLKRAKSIVSLTKELKIGRGWLDRQIKQFRINPEDLRCVHGFCAFCNKSITRRISQLNTDQKLLFCNRDCFLDYRKHHPEIMNYKGKSRLEIITNRQIALELMRATAQAKTLRKYLKLAKKNRNIWTDAKKAFLNEHWPYIDDENLAWALKLEKKQIKKRRYKFRLRRRKELQISKFKALQN